MAAVESGLVQISCRCSNDAVLVAHLIRKLAADATDGVCKELSETQLGNKVSPIADFYLESCDLASISDSCTKSLNELSFSQ